MDALVYDVAIIGGGPGGSTMAAFLAQQHGLDVALIEKDAFPRQRIGESLTHRAVTLLEESGALPKVMASQCWIKKFGGYYAWNDGDPAVSFFEHENWERDGVLRWALHVNRAEFDEILLGHAASLGAKVYQGNGAVRCERKEGVSEITLADGQKVMARFVADVSGRQTSIVSGDKKDYLSSFKNVAIWTHVLNSKKAESIQADWNLFFQDSLSAIGSFAFEDGWFWYIPVPMTVGSKRVITHSLGMVTDPMVLKDNKYRTGSDLLQRARRVPLLGSLLEEAKVAYDTTLTATNYSMISPRFCNLEEGWLLIGDAAGFVDPLFSSGVTLSMAQANAAARLIATTLNGSVSRSQAKELWLEYESAWKDMMHSFAASIDQWYHSIARTNPDSIYWRRRTDIRTTDRRLENFRNLVDASVPPDVLQVLTKGTKSVGDIGGDGPVMSALQAAEASLPPADREYRLAKGARIVDSLSHGFGIFRNRIPAELGKGTAAAYWEDPVAVGASLPPLYGEPQRAFRVCSVDDDQGVALHDTEESAPIRQRIASGQTITFGEVDSAPRWVGVALAKMIARGLLEEARVAS